ncbi:CoA ester lyase [Sphingomonas sp. ASV193]|uniref:HpcH/HpaI aldolase/citrate lyase family protein n=1 Tax=Sphingomonas sp. ASV193 TaxID=3144405 RepID=UPI0032E8F9AA
MTGAFTNRPALLFLPASNDRAIDKAQGALDPDMVILDLEDAVRDADKAAARDAAVAAVATRWRCPVGIRVNGEGTPWHADDVAAVGRSAANFVVVPVAERATTLASVGAAVGKPLLAMVESALGVLEARKLAASAAGLIVGTNDLRADLGVPEGTGRSALQVALQLTLLAARAAAIPAWDGVYNRIDDAEGFAREAGEGRSLGFDGKSLVHPSQIAPCRVAWAPSSAEVERARRLVAAFEGGAERFEGAMVEAMHVAAARALLDRAGVGESARSA